MYTILKYITFVIIYLSLASNSFSIYTDGEKLTPLEKEIIVKYANKNCDGYYKNFNEITNERNIECYSGERWPENIKAFNLEVTEEHTNTKRSLFIVSFMLLITLTSSFIYTKIKRIKFTLHNTRLFIFIFIFVTAGDISALCISIPTYFSNRYSVHYAAREGNFDLVRKLIEDGQNPNKKKINGQTALEISQRRGFDDISEYLAEFTPELNEKYFSPKTSLYTAVGSNSIKLVKKVLERDGLETQDHKRFTPLFLAACRGNLEIVKLLIENGANYSKPEHYLGKTPLDYAIMWRNNDVAKYLEIIDKKPTNNPLITSARQGNIELYYYFKSLGYHDDNIFFEAAKFGQYDFLVDLDNNNELPDLSKSQLRKLLKEIKRMRRPHGALFLLRKYPHIKVSNILNWQGRNVATAAVQMRSCELFRIAVERGANPFLKDMYGYTAIDYARSTNDPNLIHCLKDDTTMQKTFNR